MTTFPRIIVVEGDEGTGKSTLIRALENSFKDMGGTVKVYKNPNDCFPIGKMIREQILPEMDPKKRPSAPALGIIMLAALREVAEDIVENHADKDFIILDRWYFSTAVYGCFNGIVPETVGDLFHQGMAGRAFEQLLPESQRLSQEWDSLFIEPSMVVYLRASADVIQARLKDRVGEVHHLDIIDPETSRIRDELFTEVFDSADEIADEPTLVIDTTHLSPQDVHTQVVQELIKKDWIGHA